MKVSVAMGTCISDPDDRLILKPSRVFFLQSDKNWVEKSQNDGDLHVNCKACQCLVIASITSPIGNLIVRNSENGISAIAFNIAFLSSSCVGGYRRLGLDLEDIGCVATSRRESSF